MRWVFLKKRCNWTKNQRLRMREIEGLSLRTLRAFLLVETFQHFWTYISPAWAAKFLDAWCTKVARSRLEPLKKVARSLRSHRPLLLNYFKAKRQFSSGVVEGLNAKVKLTLKRSYGFRTENAREVALYHALGRLLEPEFTHSFFRQTKFPSMSVEKLSVLNACPSLILDCHDLRTSQLNPSF
jgi:transposase